MKAKQTKNDSSSAAEDIILSKIDIKSGKMTFGQRIDLGKLFSSDKSDYEKFSETFKILHKHSPKENEFKKLISYFNEIVDGVLFWINKEQELLHYDPTAEELQAGIKELSQRIGEYGTIKSLAKNYGKDPDEVLEWSYAKVFGILYTDLEEFKFQQRYNRVIERKFRTK